MMYATKVSKNKAIEISLFECGWPCIADMSLTWTLKSHKVDHWGLSTHIVLFGYKIIDLTIHDIRHSDD